MSSERTIALPAPSTSFTAICVSCNREKCCRKRWAVRKKNKNKKRHRLVRRVGKRTSAGCVGGGGVSCLQGQTGARINQDNMLLHLKILGSDYKVSRLLCSSLGFIQSTRCPKTPWICYYFYRYMLYLNKIYIVVYLYCSMYNKRINKYLCGRDPLRILLPNRKSVLVIYLFNYFLFNIFSGFIFL